MADMTLEQAIAICTNEAFKGLVQKECEEALEAVLSAAEKWEKHEKSLASIPCCPVCANTGRVQKTQVTGQTINAWVDSCPVCNYGTEWDPQIADEDAAYRAAQEKPKPSMGVVEYEKFLKWHDQHRDDPYTTMYDAAQEGK